MKGCMMGIRNDPEFRDLMRARMEGRTVWWRNPVFGIGRTIVCPSRSEARALVKHYERKYGDFEDYEPAEIEFVDREL